MMKNNRYAAFFAFFLCIGFINNLQAQTLKLKSRKTNAMGGRAFAIKISDTTLSLEAREELIFKEIKKGNVPNFLRKFVPVTDTLEEGYQVKFYVLPDYFAIGSDSDFFYMPMTPILAQRVANLIHCSLPTKKMVDAIYHQATIKLMPKPIPPTKAMTTVPVFLAHSDTVNQQLKAYTNHQNGALTAGNKKDLIISNKIYTEKTSKVVIYGWHQLNGKAIQPVYNKHTNLWADYSHGIRFVFEEIVLTTNHNEKKISLKKALQDGEKVLSDEGAIEKPYYPITTYQTN